MGGNIRVTADQGSRTRTEIHALISGLVTSLPSSSIQVCVPSEEERLAWEFSHRMVQDSFVEDGMTGARGGFCAIRKKIVSHAESLPYRSVQMQPVKLWNAQRSTSSGVEIRVVFAILQERFSTLIPTPTVQHTKFFARRSAAAPSHVRSEVKRLAKESEEESQEQAFVECHTSIVVGGSCARAAIAFFWESRIE